MGATTYRQMSGFAEQPEASGIDPESDEAASIREFATAPKVVFSSTLQEPLAMPNTRLIRSLHYFEAVARHGSVKGAAEELGVAPLLDDAAGLVQAGQRREKSGGRRRRRG